MLSSSGTNRAAVVVGSGLGGLLSACILAKNGWKVRVYEKLCFLGGKFTAFDHSGFQVPSGAFHCLPGGASGNLYRTLDSLGIAPQVVESEHAFSVRIGGRRYVSTKWPWRKDSYWSLLSSSEKLWLVALGYRLSRPSSLPDLSVAEYLHKSHAPTSFQLLLDKFMQFSCGVSADEASVIDLARSFRSQKGGREAVIVGGCRALVDSLVRLLLSSGGETHLSTEVSAISVSGGKAHGVVLADGTHVEADLIVSNAGPRVTVELLGTVCPQQLKDFARDAVPAEGVAYSVRSDSPFLPKRCVEFPLDAEYICGYVEVSQFDPSLCPPGDHYLLAYQSLSQSSSVEHQLECGFAELLRLFPAVTAADVFTVSLYRGAFPAARVRQSMGQHGKSRVPVSVVGIRDLYMLSHDSEGYGFAAEVIGDAAQRFRDMLCPGCPPVHTD